MKHLLAMLMLIFICDSTGVAIRICNILTGDCVRDTATLVRIYKNVLIVESPRKVSHYPAEYHSVETIPKGGGK